MYKFQVLPGGQEVDDGEEQTLLIWRTDSSAMDFGKMISTLIDITSELLYS